MKCADIKENLDAFADGEVGFTEEKKIENHLENCLSCKTEFANLQALGKSVKEILRVSAPASLDEKVLNDFQNFHDKKQTETSETKKIGWFGIPRFAFAAGAVLFFLATISAFQIGRMSAGEISIVMPQVQEEQISPPVKPDDQTPEKNPAPVKIVEVPVIKEKIVQIPVIKTKTVYVVKENKPDNRPNTNDLAMKNSIENNGYLTQTNLKDFQPVSEFKLKVSKEEK